MAQTDSQLEVLEMGKEMKSAFLSFPSSIALASQDQWWARGGGVDKDWSKGAKVFALDCKAPLTDSILWVGVQRFEHTLGCSYGFWKGLMGISIGSESGASKWGCYGSPLPWLGGTKALPAHLQLHCPSNSAQWIKSWLVFFFFLSWELCFIFNIYFIL